MEAFRSDGHLTDKALEALSQNQPMEELLRLDIAEHLSYCDDCLLRYTGLLTDDALCMPPVSCERALWQRIRKRTIRLVTNRYATAAAAVALMVTTLWSVQLPAERMRPERPVAAAISQSLQSWPERWSQRMNQRLGQLSDVFEIFGGDGEQSPAATQGGTNP